MEYCLVYTIKNTNYLETRGEGLTQIIKDWLRTKGLDVLVYDFILGEDSNIIVDYSFDKNMNIKRLQELTEQVFKRFNIDFDLE